MAWRDYWQEAIDEIDETEARTERTWLKALAVILAWELFLRRRTVRRALQMPVVDGGWIDWTDRLALFRFRAAVRRDTQAMIAGLGRDLGGPRNPLTTPPTPGSRPPRQGITPEALTDTVESFRESWARMQALFIAAEAEAAREIPGEVQGPPLPRQITPEALQAIEDALPAQEGRRAREVADELDVALDSLINIARNVGYDLDRVTETIVRLSGRFNRPGDIADFLDGNPEGLGARGRVSRPLLGQPWQLNRNNLRLSTTAHIRAMHRRRTISEATAAGITHFRLDVPTSRLEMLTPGSLTGLHAWEIRTLEEWSDIAAEMNRGRIGASGFDTLGLGFGDMTYVVPVPAVFFIEAQRQAERFRASRLGAGRRAA